jgi:hypothetical protein
MYHDEPSFQQMLADPIVRLMMGSDGVTPAELNRLRADLRERVNRSVIASAKLPRPASRLETRRPI